MFLMTNYLKICYDKKITSFNILRLLDNNTMYDQNMIISAYFLANIDVEKSEYCCLIQWRCMYIKDREVCTLQYLFDVYA